MNLKKKKKQLIAAALTVALSLGSAVPALSAAAPTVMAAESSSIGHGSIMLDTANYIMAPNNIYDIGVTIKDGNGNTLSASEVRSMFSSGKIKVTDSRTGSVVNLTQLVNGNFRVTAKNPGTCYIVYTGGGTHASVKIDVQKGVSQHGTAVRHTSWFTQNIGISKSGAGTTTSTPTTSSTPSSSSTPSTSTTGTTYTDPQGRYSFTMPAGYQYIRMESGLPLFANPSSTGKRFVVEAQNVSAFKGETKDYILGSLKYTCAQSGDTVTATGTKGTGVYAKYSTATNWPYCVYYADSTGKVINIVADEASVLNSVLNSLT